ncbi:MAG: pentapeptide repeat-containing protein [Ignavibacteriales bacterium]|nr:pentapeptide repeat-containing protein [Ignavibacteriales bacterium]
MLTKEQVLEKIEKGELFKNILIKGIDFHDHQFDKRIDMNEAYIENVNFSHAIFQNGATFVKARIYNNTQFTGSHFYNETDFMGTQFDNEAFFNKAHFHNKVDFTWSQFKNGANFIQTRFHGTVDFRWAQFQDDTIFALAQFHDSVSFVKAKFHKNVDFQETQFSTVVFSDSQFQASARFIGNKENRIFSNMHHADIRSVNFQKPDQVVFQTVDLSKCSIINTDLSKVELTDVIWPIKGISFHFYSRNVVYDEIAENLKDKNYPLIEKVYRDLKKNYENRGSYGEAGDFHYGEMEMRRLSQKKFFQYVSLTSFYKYLSGYGEKHWRAIFWLVFFLLIYLGIYRLIEYNSQPFWESLGKSAFHTLEVVTFQSDRLYAPATPWGRLADMFLKIIVPLQATLTILAIKRKFKR